jgi:choline-sulfatase
VAALPLAEVRQEVSRLEPPAGNPDARLDGWAPVAKPGPRRSRGPSSRLTAFLVEPRDLTLVVRCAPALQGHPPQRVTVSVNDQRLGVLTLGRELAEYRLAAPAATWRAGDNQLRFEYSWVADPPKLVREAEPTRRSEAVVWHDLRLVPGPPSPAAALPRRTGTSLELPAGTRVDWYFATGSRAVLEIPAVEGPAGLELRVLAQAAGGREEELGAIRPGGRKRWIDLPEANEPVARLSFVVVADDVRKVGTTLRIDRPRVVRRATPAGPADGGTPAEAAVPPPAAASRPPILLYVVDTLRADHLGVYGGAPELSPNLDRFAAEATTFAAAVAQSPWTRPSMATLFTGLGPLRHGVTRLDHRLPDDLETLAERLRGAGYRTVGISSNAHLTRLTGFSQGFEHFEYLPRSPPAEVVHERGLAQLDQVPRGASYLLYLHLLDPHAPYDPPADLRARFAPGVPDEAGSREWLDRLYRTRGASRRKMVESVAPLYAGEVAATDRAFGALRSELERRGEWDRLLVVFVADHGEGLGARGNVGHALDLSQEVLEVPLIVKWPGQRRGERVDGRAQQLDVLPTLLAAAGVGAPDAAGVDLRARPPSRDRAAVSHLDYADRVGLAVQWERWKWVEPESARFADAAVLYDLDADPGETHDVAAAHPIVVGWLKTLLRAERLAARGRSERAPLDAETRDALEALGYL